LLKGWKEEIQKEKRFVPICATAYRMQLRIDKSIRLLFVNIVHSDPPFMLSFHPYMIEAAVYIEVEPPTQRGTPS
jgi:hypothetical protein